tara:strand:+ start:88 stop:429 length:342 start_codon:yes stop_codon:yes gene_type:complete
MILELSTTQAADLIKERCGFSYYAAKLLTEYFEEKESLEGTPVEFDPATINEWAEYDSLHEAISDLIGPPEEIEEEWEENAHLYQDDMKTYLQEWSCYPVLEGGGIVVVYSER